MDALLRDIPLAGALFLDAGPKLVDCSAVIRNAFFVCLYFEPIGKRLLRLQLNRHNSFARFAADGLQIEKLMLDHHFSKPALRQHAACSRDEGLCSFGHSQPFEQAPFVKEGGIKQFDTRVLDACCNFLLHLGQQLILAKRDAIVDEIGKREFLQNPVLRCMIERIAVQLFASKLELFHREHIDDKAMLASGSNQIGKIAAVSPKQLNVVLDREDGQNRLSALDICISRVRMEDECH